MVEVNLPELIRVLGERVPWRVIVAGGAALLALFAAQGEAASWDTYLKGLYGVPFGVVEQAFGNDIGFTSSQCRCSRRCATCFLMLIVLSAGWRSPFIGRAARSISRSRRRAFHRALPRISLFCSDCSSSARDELLASPLRLAAAYRRCRLRTALRRPNPVAAGAVAPGGAVARGRRDVHVQRARGGLRIPVAAFVIVFGPALLMNLSSR